VTAQGCNFLKLSIIVQMGDDVASKRCKTKIVIRKAKKANHLELSG
jgi:hypothetical protein